MGASDLLQKESLVEQYVQQNDAQAAVKLLCELIESYAREKDFEKAEALHDKLYQTDPMALTEIVRAGEIIEAEKSEALDPEHIELWPDLYNNLNTKEANALYFAMQPATFEPGDKIKTQGELNSRLYFILSGEVNCSYSREKTELFFKTLGFGDIVGQNSFFSASVCTVSMHAMNRVKTHYLAHSATKQWKTDVPALEPKLRDYCRRKDRVKQELERTDAERRTDNRLAVSGRLSFQLLDKSDKPKAKVYRGEIADISSGGLSFLVKSSRADTLFMLLGRRIQVNFQIPLRSGQHLLISEPMTVIAIQPQVFDDYSIHAKFDRRKRSRFIEDIDPQEPAAPV